MTRNLTGNYANQGFTKAISLSFLFFIVCFFAKAQSDAPLADLQKQMDEMKSMKPAFGLKVGYNVAKLTGSTPDYSPDTRNGFMVSAFYAPAARTGIGYRSELVFSRQGFGFDDNGNKTSVTSDYIYFPQFTTIGITKFLQLQVGAQLGYLLKSSMETKTESNSEDITSMANRIDYGAAFGAEIYPVKNLIIGGRYNMSFGNAYKEMSTTSPMPIPNPLPFNPSEVKSKNAVINFFVGFRL